MKTLTPTLTWMSFLLVISSPSFAQSILKNGKVNFVIEDQTRVLPLRKVAFAEQIVAYNSLASDTLHYKIRSKRIEAKTSAKDKKVVQQFITIATKGHLPTPLTLK